MEASLSSCSLDFGLDFVCLQSTDLLCGTFNLANTPANTVERKLSQVKVAVVRTDNSDTAATVKLVWCCHASTPGASAAGLAVDAAWDTHCQFRCARPFCTPCREQCPPLHAPKEEETSSTVSNNWLAYVFACASESWSQFSRFMTNN